MCKRFGMIFLLLILNFWSGHSFATLTFPDWMVEQTDKYLEDLKKQNALLTPAEIELSLLRIKGAKDNNQWSVVSSEYGRVLGKDPSNRKNWLDLSLANQKLKMSENNNWRAGEESKYAAIQAYRLSQTNEEQAEALLILGHSLDPDNQYEIPNYSEVYKEIRTLVDLKKFLNEHSDLAHLMPHQFLKTEINNQTASPSVCFVFSQPLATQGVHYEDYIHISPKVEGNLKITGRQLCLSPVQFGENYEVEFKAGIPNEFLEKSSTATKISFKIKDQESRLSFSPNAYVLVREESPVIPLTGVNVDSVKLKILRMNDRALNQISQNNEGFLGNVWPYRIEQIQNEQGELLFEGEFNLKSDKNKTITKQIPFSKAIKSLKPGVYLLYAEEKNALFGDKAKATQWLIISDLGLTTFTENSGGLWVNVRSLKSAAASPDVELRLLARNNAILSSVKTNHDGMGHFEAGVTRGKGGNQPLWILAYGKNGDFSLLNLEQPGFDLSDRGVAGRTVSGPLDAFLFTEQGVYRPKETVHVNTLLRDEKSNAIAGLPLTFKVLRPDGMEVSRQVINGSAFGFYEYAIPLNESTRTGQWTVLAFADVKKDPIGRVNFSVEDFVPSRIVVKLKSEKPILTEREPVQVDVVAEYLFGAKAAGLTGTATMNLTMQANPYPKYADYYFGLVNEQFMDTRRNLLLQPLDKEGKASLKVALDSIPKTTQPLEAVVRVTLSDKGGRPEIGSLKLPVQLQPFMIGIKPQFMNETVDESASEAAFEVITVLPDQNLTEVSHLEYELYEERPHYTWYQPSKGQAWQYQTVSDDRFLSKGVLNTSSKEAKSLKVALKGWGQYRIEIRDPKTNIATSVQFSKGWAATHDAARPDLLQVKVDKDKVKTGETLQILIESPFEGQAILTIANDKILETRNITVSKKGTQVKVVANESFGRGVYCLVSAFRPLKTAEDTKAHLPKRAVGIAWVGIDSASRVLEVKIKPPQEIKPQQTIEIPIEVQAKDNPALPVNAWVSVAAVDEGILKLTDFKTPDPQTYFLGQRQLGVVMRDLYGRLIDPLPGEVGELRSGGDAGLLSRNMQALSKRSFKIVSMYQGRVSLDKQGRGKISLNIPDFNGTLRIMAVAFDEQRIGSGAADLLVRDPVVVEGTLARFLAPEDVSELNLSLHNVTGAPGNYTLTLAAKGEVAIMGKDKIEIPLEQGGHHQITVPIQAKKLGQGQVTVRLQGMGLELTREFDLSIRSPIPYTQKNISRWLKKGDSDHFTAALLKEFVPGTEAVMFSWSSGVPWDIASLYQSLRQYPYSCVEQIISRGLGSLLHGNDMDDTRQVNQTLALLSEKQNMNGSFSLWSNTGARGEVWLTAYAVDFLLRAAAKEYQVPRFTLEKALDWLATSVENERGGEQAALINSAYALYVLTKADRLETGSIRYFYDTYYEKMSSAFARAMVAGSLVQKGDIERAAQAFQTVFAKSEDSSVLPPFGTPLRDNAGILAMYQESLQKAPTLNIASTVHSLVQTLNQSLQNNTRLSTQEEVWVLVASHEMMDNNPKKPFEIVINGQKESSATSVFTKSMTPEISAEKGIHIQNPGPESLWQTLSVSGIPKEVTAERNGFAIERRYYNLQGTEVSPAQVVQGTELVVVLTGKALDLMHHQILIVDMLPAGFELQNANLDSGSDLGQFAWLKDLNTATHTELRDDRYLSFINFDEKQRSFNLAYLVRAVTPGRYVHPGLWVEDMYAPQYFARTESKTVQISAP